MRKTIAGAAIVALAITGCADPFNEDRGRGDAAVENVDDSAKEVIQFPDRFANVAHACDGHGNRVFVTTRTEESGMQMSVIADPSCGGDAR